MTPRLLSALLAPAILIALLACGDNSATSFEYTLNGEDQAADEAVADEADEAVETVEEIADETLANAGELHPILAQVDQHLAAIKVSKNGAKWKTQLPKPPVFEMPSDAKITWVLETNEGTVRVALWQNVAPMHVSSTIFLTRVGFYDGVGFHRVIPGFMAQGGDPLGNGRGGPGYMYGSEFAPNARHDGRGILSMANAGQGTDGSQFFLTFSPQPGLNNKHTVFGKVATDEASQATLARFEQLGNPYNNGVPPKSPITISRATIEIE